jgi:hypothetical protein
MGEKVEIDDDFWEYWYLVPFQVRPHQSDSHPRPFLHTLTKSLARKVADWVYEKSNFHHLEAPYCDHTVRINNASVKADRHGTFQLEFPVLLERLLQPREHEQLLAVVTAWTTAEPAKKLIHDDDSDTVMSVKLLRPLLHKIAIPDRYWDTSNGTRDDLRRALQVNEQQGQHSLAHWAPPLLHTERDMQRTLQAFGQPGPGSILSLIIEREQGRHRKRPEVREADEHRWQARILYDLLTKIMQSSEDGALPRQIEKQADWMGQAAAIMEDGARNLVVSLDLSRFPMLREESMIDSFQELSVIFRRLSRL